APNAAQYRVIMGAFVRAKSRFTVHLRPEDVHEALAATPYDLPTIADGLSSLVAWGNLRADPDTSRVTSVEDFHRARYLYQLTTHGEAVEQAVATYDEALGRRGALQAVALTDIATQLRALIVLAGQERPDPAKVHLTLRTLVDRYSDLADNAQAFMGSLQRTIDLHDSDTDTFLAYKDQLIAYLERFIRDLIGIGAEIAELISELEQGDVQALLEAAAAREAEDAAPDDDDPRRSEFERGRASWQLRWEGFRGWFLSAPGHPSQAKLLRSRARAAIPQLLQVVSTLNERRAGRSDRSADFRALARWFAHAPDEDAMHRLWHVAFGLSSARHLTVDDEQLADPVPPTTPWREAPPLQISPQLRKTGSYERRGRPRRVIDRAAQRRHLAELAAREAAETAAARAALATTHPTRLSDLGELDADAFRLFLRLLSDALAARVPGQARVETTTTDGTLAVRMTALADGAMAQIHTGDGVLRGPDHLVEIVDLTSVERAERTA
ncbi:MAG: TIGR02677 family protein, partial [Thermocrispum sp.]